MRERDLIEDKRRRRWVAMLLHHEFVHSWCGKHRRPAAMVTPNFHTPERTSLLWVYGGLTQYLAEVLQVRSGLTTTNDYMAELAGEISVLMHTEGRRWRPLEDTAIANHLLRAFSPSWGQLRRSQDYYDEGMLLWLEADAIIRQQSDDTELQQMRILMTIRALGPVIVVVDEADAVFGSRDMDSGDSGVSSRIFAAFAAHIGDSSLRGRELWVAMTSRPDLLAIDMKRQGRFGLCVPLFPALGPDDVLELFTIVAGTKKITLADEIKTYIREHLGNRPLTGSDVEAILTRAKERAVLAKHDDDVQLGDLEEAVNSFIDPLDPELLALQELAAVLACSDRRYLPERYRDADRATLMEQFAGLKLRAGRR